MMIEDIEEPEEIEIKDNAEEIISEIENENDEKEDKELKIFGRRIELPKLLKKNDDSEETKPVHDPDEIRKFKALLDDGIITEEEYEQKKKEILGL